MVKWDPGAATWSEPTATDSSNLSLGGLDGQNHRAAWDLAEIWYQPWAWPSFRWSFNSPILFTWGIVGISKSGTPCPSKFSSTRRRPNDWRARLPTSFLSNLGGLPSGHWFAGRYMWCTAVVLVTHCAEKGNQIKGPPVAVCLFGCLLMFVLLFT